MFVIASLVTVSTGGCGGGGADKANVTPVTLPTVSAPAAVQPAGKVATPEAGQGPKAEAARSSDSAGDGSSKSEANQTGTATHIKQGVQSGSSGKAPVTNLPGNGTEPTAESGGSGPKGPPNGTE